PNIHEWIIAALGAQSAGGVLVPFSTRMKGAEAAYVLNKSRARILLTMGEFLGTNYVKMLRGHDLPALEKVVVLRGQEQGTEAWSAFLAAGSAVSPGAARAAAAAVRSEDLSDILFTSGTTGNPKGVMTEHGQNLRTFAEWTRTVGLRAGDRY